MTSYRIHAIDPEPTGKLPYVTVARHDQQLARFSFCSLDPELDGLGMCMSLASLYGLLEGKAAAMELPFASCLMRPEGDALVVNLDVEGQGIRFTKRLGLSELALAWNLMVDRQLGNSIMLA